MTRFPFKSFDTEHLGIIKKPFGTMRITHNSCTIKGNFLIDSGADITIIPYQLGEKGLGFFLGKGEEVINLGGAGGGVIPTVLKDVEMELAGEKIEIRIAWALVDTVPLILGRIDIFEKFHIEFREDEGVVIFEKVSQSRS